MRIAFLASDKPREQLLADAFLMGAKKHGHAVEVLALDGGGAIPGRYDVACMVGVKSRELWEAHKRAGIPVIYLDKGYCRQKRRDGAPGWEYWRVSINEHHPTERLMRPETPADRWNALDIAVSPYRKKGRQIVFAGSSEKYHSFYGLRDATDYAAHVVGDARKRSKRPIIYRPKPSWADAVPVPGARFSRSPERISEVLTRAWVLVTHGSNACFEAMLAGIPCIVLGNAIAKPISSTSLLDIEEPRMPSERERAVLLANLAWWQWRQSEMASGSAWDFIGRELHA